MTAPPFHIEDSAPDAIADKLRELHQSFERIGLEAGPLPQWIYAGLVDKRFASTRRQAFCVYMYREDVHAALSERSTRPTVTMPGALPR